ncbi:MAG: hypothetical protein HOM23_00915 [Porticoccaceae bacterium]|jgi:hypothetical protein|nr:hypothetical protein [Porticoccaceae bacterium]MBT5796927.1 hypothetical protein [Porticoccaceae bacterium]
MSVCVTNIKRPSDKTLANYQGADVANIHESQGQQLNDFEVTKNGKSVGISHYPVYTSNVSGWISLALLDEAVAAPGTEVSIRWGEPDGGSMKPTVERHIQTEISAVVEQCPISVTARETYKK